MSETSVYRSVASQVSAASRDHRVLFLRVFPDLDSVLAASIAFTLLRRNGVDSYIVLDPLPPSTLREPVLLLGYPSSTVESISDVHAPSGLIGRGERPQGLTRIPVVSSDESSVSALTVAVFSELTVVGDPSVYAIVAGYWRRLDRGRRGEFTGAEAQLVESLMAEGKLDGGLTLRLFRWFEEPVEDSIEVTVDPFLPGLTGHPDSVERFLSEDPRLRSARGKPVKLLSDESITLLASKLYELLKSRSRVQRRPSELIGHAYYSELSPVRDLREAATILACLGVEGGDAVAGTALSPRQVMGWAHYQYYARGYEGVVGALDRALEEGVPEPRRLGRFRVLVVDEASCLPVVERQLRLLGLLPGDSVLAVPGERGPRVWLESLVGLYGYQRVAEALSSGCLVYEAPGLTVELVEEKCRELG